MKFSIKDFFTFTEEILNGTLHLLSNVSNLKSDAISVECFMKDLVLSEATDRVVGNRSSRQEVFCNKDVLKNLTKFTGKHLCQSLFFNKVAGLQLYLKKDSSAGVLL